MRLVFLILCMLSMAAEAAWQREFSVGGSDLETSAVMQINSTSKGAIFSPVMTEAQRDLIGSPAAGLGVYNSTDGFLNLHDGTSWLEFIFSGSTQVLTNKTIDADSNTLSNISNTQIKTGAEIERAKLSTETANYVLVNDGSGVMSEEQFLDKTRGGTGITSTATFPASGTVVTEAGVQTITLKDIDGGTASNTSRITIPKDTQANIDLLTDKEGTLWYASDTDKLFFNDGTDNVELSTSSGSSNLAITTVTTTYTALLTDDVIIATSGVADYDVDLPTAVGNTGKVFTIIKNFSGFILNVDPDGVESLGIHSNYYMGETNSFVTIVSDGASWQIMSSRNPVKVRYNTSAGQSIPSGVQTVVDYGTLFHETHPGWVVTGAAWKFTSNLEGKYSVRFASLANAQPFSQGNVWLPIIRKNSTNVGYAMPYEFTFTGTQRAAANGFIEINLNVGDTVHVEILQNQGGFRTLDTDSIGNFIEIRAEF